MKTLTVTEKEPTYGAQFDALRQQLELQDKKETTYVPYMTPAYERLSLTDRMEALFPTPNHLGAYTPLRERSEVFSPARLLELDLASYSPVGSFKFRGAWNAVASVDHQTLLRHGVITASAGNHALGVALAVNRLNELYHSGKYSSISNRERVRARIFVPQTAAPVKIDHIKEIGGDEVELIVGGTSYADAFALAQEAVKYSPNSRFIHPYNDEAVIAGQSMAVATLPNLLKDKNIDPSNTVLVVPVGGGGLLDGVVRYLMHAYPNKADRPKIVGAQLEGSDSAARTWSAFKAYGDLTPISVEGDANYFADGAAVQKVGEITAQCLPYVDDFVVIHNEDLAKGYIHALDAIAMNYMEVYGNHGVDPFYGLHEPASMIAEVAATTYAMHHEDQVVINLKTGINYNPELIEKIVNNA